MSDTINISGAELGEDTQRQHGNNPRKRRRSLRKGTHSCWACKRRKEKCTFENGDVCNGCIRRGTSCVSQLFPEEDATHVGSGSASATATRLQRIENMVARLATQVQNASQFQEQSQMGTPPLTAPSPSPAQRVAFSQAASSTSTTETPFTTPGASRELAATSSQLAKSTRLQVLCETLRNSLPSRQDIELLQNATARLPVLSTIHLTKSYNILRRDGFQSTDGLLLEPPVESSDPVTMAKYMLQLAIFLQETSAIAYPELAFLNEPATVISERCATTAIALVTRQDDLLGGSIDSLEIVVLESFYQCNSGRLRLSWMAVQRAIVLAHTMGLHLVRSSSNGHPRDTLYPPRSSQACADLPHLWFRIVHHDLQLSRMLGLPPRMADVARDKTQGSSTSFDAAIDTPESYLERVYSEVMILALAHRPSDPNPPDAQATQALELQLQRAANAIPSHWWLPPNLAESSKNPVTLFWDMRRLLTQMLHHDLRSQLNVPCMLVRGKGNKQRSEMARMACVHSSREVLSRFILLRDFNQSVHSCRFANFLGLMAAITLVLAHLGGSTRQPHGQTQDPISDQVDSLLAHQAPSDRAMMEKALEAMQNMTQSSGDALSEQCAHVLHRLLDIHTTNNLYAAESPAYVSVQERFADTTTSNDTTGDGEPMFIPYFGVLRIVRPQGGEAARGVPVTTTIEAGTATQPSYFPTHNDVELIDPLLLELRDEHWMSQTIDMTFLDAFLDGTM